MSLEWQTNVVIEYVLTASCASPENIPSQHSLHRVRCISLPPALLGAARASSPVGSLWAVERTSRGRLCVSMLTSN
jgi:hypothetical protein